jgi:hypothetical protein
LQWNPKNRCLLKIGYDVGKLTMKNANRSKPQTVFPSCSDEAVFSFRSFHVFRLQHRASATHMLSKWQAADGQAIHGKQGIPCALEPAGHGARPEIRERAQLLGSLTNVVTCCDGYFSETWRCNEMYRIGICIT